MTNSEPKFEEGDLVIAPFGVLVGQVGLVILVVKDTYYPGGDVCEVLFDGKTYILSNRRLRIYNGPQKTKKEKDS
jgi:hypothetical protein